MFLLSLDDLRGVSATQAAPQLLPVCSSHPRAEIQLSSPRSVPSAFPALWQQGLGDGRSPSAVTFTKQDSRGCSSQLSSQALPGGPRWLLAGAAGNSELERLGLLGLEREESVLMPVCESKAAR